MDEIQVQIKKTRKEQTKMRKFIEQIALNKSKQSEQIGNVAFNSMIKEEDDTEEEEEEEEVFSKIVQKNQVGKNNA